MNRLTIAPLTAPLTVAVLSLSLLVAGCGASSEDAEAKNDPPIAQAGGEWTVSNALAEIPASAVGEAAWVQTADLTAALAAAGLKRSAGGGTSSIGWCRPAVGPA
ncbi:MAG: hypothetical protein L0H31_16875, partial [Nocardioidaceae bacterium]|nr:hypothetical protein [Nocardioidaceae bacterium]